MDNIEEWEEVKQYLLSKGVDLTGLSGRGNNKNSDIIMDEDGEIVGFEMDGKVFM